MFFKPFNPFTSFVVEDPQELVGMEGHGGMQSWSVPSIPPTTRELKDGGVVPALPSIPSNTTGLKDMKEVLLPSISSLPSPLGIHNLKEATDPHMPAIPSIR